MGATVENDQLDAAASTAKQDVGLPDPIIQGGEARAEVVETERNPIFDSLVKVEGEVSGLVAYSIYKQNKRAWLTDFQKIVGRPPNEGEMRAYIIGESTGRRLATYRHLAQATLAGEGPEGTGAARGFGGGLAGRASSFYVVWAVVLVAAIAVLAYALHSSLPIAKP